MRKKIATYLSPSLIAFLDAESRGEVLKQMVDRLFQEGKLKDKELFLRAIVEREKIVSTGIGMGVAIPHAKLSEYDDFFIAIAILKRGVDWEALDDVPVRIVFMIGGPDDKQTEYLQILSSITSAIKDETMRKKMLTLTSPDDIMKLFKEL